MTLRTVLLSLQALLAAAEPDDPQDAVVAKQYKESPEVFYKTARHWSCIYAGGKPSFSAHPLASFFSELAVLCFCFSTKSWRGPGWESGAISGHGFWSSEFSTELSFLIILNFLDMSLELSLRTWLRYWVWPYWRFFFIFLEFPLLSICLLTGLIWSFLPEITLVRNMQFTFSITRGW